MTFDEWWKSKKTLIETVVNNNKSHIDLIVFIKSIMNIAWDISQPKWTYCKDGMPKNGEKVIALNFIKEMYICNYYSLPKKCNWTCMGVDIENVIAWMPLPEAPDNIDK